MSWNDKVVWSEGMFLQPQHFQQHDRYLERVLAGRTAPLQGHAWGFSALEIDPAALAVGKIQVVAASGILPDGTPFDFPHADEPPPPLDIGADVKDELVVLALPVRRPGTAETGNGDDSGTALTRYYVGETEVGDSNTSAAGSVSIQIGHLRLKLALKRDAADAYTTLGVARVRERRTDNTVVLHKSYVPPMLAIAADPVLAGYAAEIHGLLHQRGDALAARLTHPGRGGVAEIADFLFLQTINRYEPLFAHLIAHPLVHPERLYATCVALAGDLATFSHDNRRAAAFPPYKQDALEECFPPLMADLRRSFSIPIEASAIPIELADRKFGVKVAVIRDLELLKNASFVFAVNAQMPPDALRQRFPSQTTVGPAEKIRDLVTLHLPGIPLRVLPVAPRQIPYHAGSNYFELERGGELWQQLERSGGLAMHIAGEFPGLDIEFWAIRG
jgi:type VI secretion system protein ImpJ